MNTYRVWVSGQKAQTLETLQAETSIAARLKVAHKYRLKTYDVVAQRSNPGQDDWASYRLPERA